MYELASEQGVADDAASALKAFRSLMEESPDLRRLVKSPVFSAHEQIKALDAILAAAAIKGIAANFIRLVAAKRRLFALPEMIAAFERLHEAGRGVVRADVTVVAPLESRHEEALRDALKGLSPGKTIDLNVKVDPSIIGGLVVKLGSRMFDASLKTKLNSIRTRMKEVG